MWLLILLALLALPALQTGAADDKASDINQVQAALEQTLSSDPRNVDALFTLGLLYEKKHQPQDALRIWRQYLTVETNAEKRDIAQRHIHQLSQ